MRPTTVSYLLTFKPSVVSDVDLLDCLVVLLGRSLQGFLGAPVSDGKFITKYYITLHYCGIFWHHTMVISWYVLYICNPQMTLLF